MQMQNARSSARHTPRELKAMILVAMLWAPVGVYAAADNPGASMFLLSGFGTLGLVHSSEDQADFTSTLNKPDGAGYSHSWSADVDSVIGAQVTASFTSRLSAVLQLVSEQNYDGTYRPHVEWGNIKYQFTPDFSVRAGRIVLPSFLLSDTRKVGYTYPWVRPPSEVYHLLPITNSDGVDVSYRLHFGEWTNTVQANAGRSDLKFPNDAGSIETRNLWSISNTLENGPLTAHINYQESRLNVAAIAPFFDAFRQFGPQGVAIADKYNSDNKPFSFVGAGASYDPGNWFVMGEWGSFDAHSFIGKRTAWYVSGGYRFGKFTPYATYAEANSDNLSDPGLTVSALPPFLAGPATGLNAALNANLNTKPVQNTVSVGGRWDFLNNMDFKLQLDHTRVGAGSTGIVINPQPGLQLGGKLTVFSVTIDLVL